MSNAKVYEKIMSIPTYGVGCEEKNPMFFEKRVYQGSSGKVYPYPVIEKIYDEKHDKEYNAVILENDWLYVIVLPEIGGRIYTAYDKTNGYDFVYHNKVIKPALVGLLGPWISGGIEFNWPQHHRPTTFKSVNYQIKKYFDGSASVIVGESEAMFGLKHTTEIKLYSDKSYIEIKTDVYNRGNTPETFLWWANPAFRVNDDTATIMPLDVTAVMDHGKRAVSTFPIARGEYYKMDYSSGVDISRYKNIPVPTSFMAYKSDFDFVGGYDYGRKAGLLHVADHHVAPGKKQWTWGSGDFGIAWDRNLTDEDGPYVELMTGCFTDNQPDFTYIRPQETKSFTQYFLPYHEVGKVINADKNICFGIENDKLIVYSSAKINAHITVKEGNKSLYNDTIKLNPTESVEIVAIKNVDSVDIVVEYDGKIVRFNKDMVNKFDIPSPATPCPPPEDCKTIEELYLYGLHIEQYRHATRLPESYYLEGLKRDESDMRINNAYGMLLMRRGQIKESIPYFERAIAKSIIKNPNPRDTEPYFNCGMAYFMTGEIDKAYDLLYKCVWGNNKAEAYYYMSVIEYLRGNLDIAIEHGENAVSIQGRNTRAYNTLGRIYRDIGDEERALTRFRCAIDIDALDITARYEIGESGALRNVTASEMRVIAVDYIAERRYAKLIDILTKWAKESGKSDSLIELYIGYAEILLGNDAADRIARAKDIYADNISFASSLADIQVLSAMYENYRDWFIAYQLGNLFYDKRNYEKAAEYWLESAKTDSKFPTARRNLALYYFNKKRDHIKALKFMEDAFKLDRQDSRVLLELFQLYGLTGKSRQEQYKLLKNNLSAVEARDDLYLEYLILLAENGEYNSAFDKLMSRKFHPWEGGEGKVTKLYKILNIAQAKEADEKGDFSLASECYSRCFKYPENLGEGKLILDYDNDICYMLGELYEKYGDRDRAKEYYRLATRGKTEIADNIYYNDNPIEYVYYIALANKKLGNIDKANEIKDSFMNYYAKHVGEKAVIDYFAVSLPDMLIWEQDIDEKNKAFLESLKALAESI